MLYAGRRAPPTPSRENSAKRGQAHHLGGANTRFFEDESAVAFFAPLNIHTAGIGVQRDSTRGEDVPDAGYGSDEYVASDETGQPYHPNLLTFRWGRMLDVLGIEQVRLQDARHSCAIPATPRSQGQPQQVRFRDSRVRGKAASPPVRQPAASQPPTDSCACYLLPKTRSNKAVSPFDL